ncbi:MAG TPA: glycerophosphodiester phosphodiesterase [Gammaproteobacteria bacterium]|nr:glycerophosphodiester phosphodiesterase [Gammaproteobacteria bacterium]
MYNVKNSWILALEHLRNSWQQVLVTHLAYTAVGVVLFTPLIGFTGRLLLRLSGQTALADQDIAYFLLSPFGMFALIIFAALLIGILAYEQAALMRVAIGVMHQQRVGTFDALLYTAARVKKLFLFTTRLVARVLILTLPFLAVAAGIALFLITDYDINYYLTEKPPEFMTAVILIAVVLIPMVILLIRKLLSWSLALPLVLFGGVSPAESFNESVRITQGNRNLILAILATWAGLAILLGVVVLGVIRLLGSWVIPGVSDSLGLLVVVLGGISALWMLSSFLITTFTSGCFAYLVMGIYEQYGPALNAKFTERSQQDEKLKTLRLTPKRIAVVLVAGVAAAGLTGAWLIKGIQVNDDVTIVAHRGAAGKAPENTLAAFHQAIDDKTDWIELDVQETVDGEVIVMHDSDFMKLAGNEIKVWDVTLAQLSDIDIGSWFDSSFSNERTPTLKKVLELSRGKANVVIELKYYGHDEMLEQRVVDIVEEAGMVNETAIMSLKYDAVKKVRALRPEWNIGLLSATAIGDLTSLDADFLAVAMGMASGGFVRRAHEAGKQVFVWTVNDPVSMSRMMSLGVDGIITDEPEMARQVLADRKELNSVERLLIHTALLFGQSFTPKQYRDDSP